MFSWIRSSTGTWTARVVFFLVLMVFALFGVYGSLDSGLNDSTTVAEIDDYPVTIRQLDQYYQSLLQDPQNRSNPDQTELKQIALQQLVNRALLLQNAKDLGLMPESQTIAKKILVDETFFTDGRFDRRKYNQYLKDTNTSVIEYEEILAETTALELYTKFINDLSRPTKNSIDLQYKSLNKKINLHLLNIPKNLFTEAIAISDLKLQDYLNSNQERYKTNAEYYLDSFAIKGDEELFGKLPEIATKDLSDYFQANRNDFKIKEQFDSAHILIEVNDKRNQDQALLRAEEVYDKAINDLDKFEELALTYSDDPSVKINSGNLGSRSLGELDPTFEEAIKALKVGDISKPVLTRFGYHVILLKDKRPAGFLAFNKARPQIEEILTKNIVKKRVEDFYSLKGERFNFEEFDRIKESFKISTLDNVLITAGSDPYSIEDTAEFENNLSEMAKASDNKAGIVKTINDSLVVFKLKRVVDSFLPELDTVKDKVTSDYKNEIAQEKVIAAVDKINVSRPKSLADLKAVASEYKVAEPSMIEVANLSQEVPNIGYNAELHQAIFELNSANRFKTYENEDSIYALLFIDADYNQEINAQNIEFMKNSIDRLLEGYYYDKLLANLEEEYTVNYNQGLIDAYYQQ